MSLDNINKQLTELLENNSVEITDTFDEPSGDNTMEGHHSNDDTEVPQPVLDGGNLDAPVSS